jgi:thiamine-monophosphate kinase
MLAGGDDYELLFTAPEAATGAILEAGRAAEVPVTRFGRVDAIDGLRLVDAAGRAVTDRFGSFDHFRSEA